MIRCRCGTWTDYGMTCSRCADAWNKVVLPPKNDDEEEEEVEEELISLEELEAEEDENESE